MEFKDGPTEKFDSSSFKELINDTIMSVWYQQPSAAERVFPPMFCLIKSSDIEHKASLKPFEGADELVPEILNDDTVGWFMVWTSIPEEGDQIMSGLIPESFAGKNMVVSIFSIPVESYKIYLKLYENVFGTLVTIHDDEVDQDKVEYTSLRYASGVN